MKNQFIKSLIVLIIFTTMAISCNTVERDWKKTNRENSVEAFTEFIGKHPESEYADSAKMKILQLECVWNDGYLDRTYSFNDELAKTLGGFFTQENSILYGFSNIEKGSIKTFMVSSNGEVRFTEVGLEGGFLVSVRMVKEDNQKVTIGFKINDGDKVASLHFHKLLTID